MAHIQRYLGTSLRTNSLLNEGTWIEVIGVQTTLLSPHYLCFLCLFFGTRGFEGWVTMGGEGIRKADKVLGLWSDLRFGFLGSVIPSPHGVIGFGRGFCVICTIIYHLG